MTLDSATSVTVSGNNGLNLGTNTAAKITTDASGVAGDNSLKTSCQPCGYLRIRKHHCGVNLTITGGAGNTLTGNLNADTISGGAGNDTLTAGLGADTVDGGAGTDTYVTTAAMTAADIEGAGTGTSTGMAVNLLVLLSPMHSFLQDW